MNLLFSFLATLWRALETAQHTFVAYWQRNSNERTFIIVCVTLLLWSLAYTFIFRSPDQFPVDDLVVVKSGMTLRDISESLYEQKVIRSPMVFRFFLSAFGGSRSARSGDYVFKSPASVWTVARAIARGQFGLTPIAIRVPEGATTKDMAIIFGKRLPRFDRTAFLREATPQEGFLFPDTYHFLPNATHDVVIQTMRQNFDEKIAPYQLQITAFGKPLRDVIIMASIIEREASIKKDREMISGVLWNRMDKNMLLQVDAVFLYTLGKGTFQLTRADLKSDSPYNTYRYKGLPPTPIGSPSLESIVAAITPVKHNYLFYLADKYGATYYAKNYQDHLVLKRKHIGAGN